MTYLRFQGFSLHLAFPGVPGVGLGVVGELRAEREPGEGRPVARVRLTRNRPGDDWPELPDGRSETVLAYAQGWGALTGPALYVERRSCHSLFRITAACRLLDQLERLYYALVVGQPVDRRLPGVVWARDMPNVQIEALA